MHSEASHVTTSICSINVVLLKQPDTGGNRAQQLYALLFGLSSSFFNYGRAAAFLESMGRRILHLLFDFYVDDGLHTDQTTAGNSGMDLLVWFLGLLGLPPAPEKLQPMHSCNTYLGIVHHMEQAHISGEVKFDPKPATVQKAQEIMSRMVQENSCTPGQASKIRGVLTFLATAMYASVGRGGLLPFKQRQYTDTPPWTLSNSLRRSIDFFQRLLSNIPGRMVMVQAPTIPPVVVASDASAEYPHYRGGGLVFRPRRSGEQEGVDMGVPGEPAGSMGLFHRRPG